MFAKLFKGEGPGHPFRGNQYTLNLTGGGGNTPPEEPDLRPEDPPELDKEHLRLKEHMMREVLAFDDRWAKRKPLTHNKMAILHYSNAVEKIVHMVADGWDVRDAVANVVEMRDAAGEALGKAMLKGAKKPWKVQTKYKFDRFFS